MGREKREDRFSATLSARLQVLFRVITLSHFETQIHRIYEFNLYSQF